MRPVLHLFVALERARRDEVLDGRDPEQDHVAVDAAEVVGAGVGVQGEVVVRRGQKRPLGRVRLVHVLVRHLRGVRAEGHVRDLAERHAGGLGPRVPVQHVVVVARVGVVGPVVRAHGPEPHVLPRRPLSREGVARDLEQLRADLERPDALVQRHVQEVPLARRVHLRLRRRRHRLRQRGQIQDNVVALVLGIVGAPHGRAQLPRRPEHHRGRGVVVAARRRRPRQEFPVQLRARERAVAVEVGVGHGLALGLELAALRLEVRRALALRRPLLLLGGALAALLLYTRHEAAAELHERLEVLLLLRQGLLEARVFVAAQRPEGLSVLDGLEHAALVALVVERHVLRLLLDGLLDEPLDLLHLARVLRGASIGLLQVLAHGVLAQRRDGALRGGDLLILELVLARVLDEVLDLLDGAQRLREGERLLAGGGRRDKRRERVRRLVALAQERRALLALAHDRFLARHANGVRVLHRGEERVEVDTGDGRAQRVHRERALDGVDAGLGLVDLGARQPQVVAGVRERALEALEVALL
mmetsp:Transcript_1586/g.4342  ORF Transcript_1586/g.4342 Transcript_1586/m.4342 type:complete len:531 (-) Transcript_1586:514-2106(-)